MWKWGVLGKESAKRWICIQKKIACSVSSNVNLKDVISQIKSD
jgi:hypothetical protein